MVTASQLRQDVYNLLDKVLESGTPLEIRRKGRVLRIVPDKPAQSPLGGLKSHDTVIGDPDDLVHLDWSDQWSAEL